MVVLLGLGRKDSKEGKNSKVFVCSHLLYILILLDIISLLIYKSLLLILETLHIFFNIAAILSYTFIL